MKLQYLLSSIILFTLSTIKVSGQTNEGFTKVKKEEGYFLIDSAGSKYKLATSVEQLDASITALDLQNNGLAEIPRSVFQHKQLKVLLLNNNSLTSLPPEIGNLTNLTLFYLFENPIPAEEQEKIKKLLPNCQISF